MWIALALWACHPVVETEPVVGGPPEPPVVRDDGVVRIEGAPEVPAALAERLQRYHSVRSAGLVDISPDGQTLLIRTRFGETYQLHELDHPMGARQQLTFRSEPVTRGGFTPDGDTWFRADVGGDEHYQLWRMDAETGEETRLTDASCRNSFGAWSNAGDRLSLSNSCRNGTDTDVWVSDGQSPTSLSLVTEAEGSWWSSSWSPDDSRLLVEHYRSISDSAIFELEVATGERHDISPPEPTAAYWGGVYGPDTGSLYVSSDREGEFVELYRYDRGEGSWTSMSRDIAGNVEGIARAQDGATVLFTVNEGGWSQLYRLDTASGERKRIESVPPGIVRDLTAARDADVVALTHYGPTSPGDVYTLDLTTDALVRWTHSEVGGLPTDEFIEPELITFESFDGLEIPAFYYRPPGEGPFPVVISIHGGPEGQSRPYLSSRTQYMLRESGVAALIPNVRGSTGYGKTYVGLDNGFKREDSVKDIGALLDWVKTREELDSERVAVRGGSYGGYMVLASLVHYSDRLVAGVDVVGIANFVTFLENTSDYRRDLRRVEYGDERDPEMRAHLEAISPANQADKIQTALFVVHGANDPRVPVGEAEQIVAAVRAQGRDAWLMLARNEGHGMGKKANRDLYSALEILFLEQHLGLRDNSEDTSEAPSSSP